MKDLLEAPPPIVTIHHPLFCLLAEEHAEIVNKLEAMRTGVIKKEDIQWLWTKAELGHHLREEKILFNYLLSDPRVDGGGPLCMLYMDGYIMNSPLDRAKYLTGVWPALEEHQAQIFEKGSAMQIPVNEHRAGKDILRFLLEKWDTLEAVQARKCFEEYRKLQKDNIQKEENCFFFLCASLLTVQQADELFEKFSSSRE